MDLPEMLKAIIRHVMRGTLFYGLFEYRIVEQVNDRVTLQRVGDTEGLPDQLHIDKAHGIAGASEDCKPGTLVLVGFKGGNPGQPFVAHYLGGALKVAIDAATEIRLGGVLAMPIANGLGTKGAIDALSARLDAVIAHITTGVPGSPVPITSAATFAGTPAPDTTSLLSAKVKAE